VGSNIGQIKDQTSTAGVEFMDSAQDALIAAIRSIRDQADSVFKKIEQWSGKRFLAWKCAACGHTEHFTRPALAEVAGRCPKCEEAVFELS
jgi:predicted nucleic-acid-binding Zn-ribbon protein